MNTKFLLTLGWLWPFIVACGAIGLIASGYSLRSDAAFELMGLLSLVGSPAVIVSVYKLLPERIPDGPRHALALVLGLVIVALELLLAVMFLALCARWSGYGWIE